MAGRRPGDILEISYRGTEGLEGTREEEQGLLYLLVDQLSPT